MSSFDTSAEAPTALRSESLNISLNFTRTGPTTGRLSWNIPSPSTGCNSQTQAYCGMVLTIDTNPTSITKLPINGTIYNSDSNIDPNLFTGDHIGSSMVIGGFYNDTNTTIMDVSGLTPDSAYYCSAFPTDCQNRYFTEGVHAYSLDYTNKGNDGTKGTQIVVMGQSGIAPTDGTGLLSGNIYDFTLQVGLIPKPNNPVDPLMCNPGPNRYPISINGTNAQTYSDLIKEINKQISVIGGVYQGTNSPNTGSLYWNNNHLYSWNGIANTNIPVIIQSTDPTLILSGSYWENSTGILYERTNLNTWIAPVVLKSNVDPLHPIADVTIWLNGNLGYIWNGAAWCTLPVINQLHDPSTMPIILPGSYWHNPTANKTYKWDMMGIWIDVDPIYSYIDPTNIVVDTIWFNSLSNIVYVYNGSSWIVSSNYSISEIPPNLPANGKLWYNPVTSILHTWNSSTTNWDITPLIISDIDPIPRSSCDLWYNTTTNQLKAWDALNLTWNLIPTLFNQTIDPTTIQVITKNTIWINNGVVTVWSGNCFNVNPNVIQWNVDPTTIPVDSIWQNTTTLVYSKLSITHTWNIITPIKSVNDPAILPSGTYWYDSLNDTLLMWNGASWISILYSTTSPTPTKNTLWYNTTTNKLMSWNGTNWILAIPKATVEIDCHNNLLFTDNIVGSLSYINVEPGTLFQNLTPTAIYNPNKPGTDKVSDVPTWKELGIGTDGSKDQRLQMASEIKYELGYPVIDVELTPEQVDYAITKALSELRQKSGIGYKNGYFFLNTSPDTQKYYITNKINGMNKIVDILDIQRVNSLASGGHDSGIYGNIFANFLYNAGNFDMLSYHLMSEYKKMYEIIFAQRIQFHFNETDRTLTLFQRTPYKLFLALDCVVERTEQDLMVDRYSYPWIRRYATAVCRIMLAEIRGKYSSLPGAGGSISLNASDLRAEAQREMDACLLEIENYVVDTPEQYGMASSFTFG